MSAQRLADAARELLERLAAREASVPLTGAFEPVIERATLDATEAPACALILRVGPGQDDGADKRFLDVRVATANDGSDSSTWIAFEPTRELFARIHDRATIAAVVDAAREGALELRKHALG